MKTVNDNRQPYEAPRIEVIEIEVEKGFAMSGYGNDTEDYYEFGERF